MSNHDPQHQLEYLLGEIKELVGARHLSYVVQDATGVFVPGFAALPAVTILANESWKTRAKPEPETWRTGDLIALSQRGDSTKDARLQQVFFTPICDVTLPLIDISPVDEASRFQQSFRLAPNDRWNDVDLQFAIVPWPAGDGSDAEWKAEEIRVIAGAFEKSKRRLEVTADVSGRQVRLDPAWGPSASLPPAMLDSVRFPLNHARECVSPFLFRVTLKLTMSSVTGEVVSLERQPVTLTFTYPEEALTSLFRGAGLGAPRHSGISLFANAIPLANMDLKAWPVGDTFADFVREAGMKPLGVAGIFRYKRVGEPSAVDPVQSHSNVFSMEIDRDGMVLSRYALPGEDDSVKEKQLLLWMTLGKELSNEKFQYKPVSLRQPMEKSSEMLVNARTVVPCFGGAECFPSDKKDPYGNLMLSVAAVPQMFAFRDGLVRATEEVISGLGYDKVTVDGVHPELRLINGERKRVVAVYLKNTGRNPLDPLHLRALQGYLLDRSPIGTTVCVEEAG